MINAEVNFEFFHEYPSTFTNHYNLAIEATENYLPSPPPNDYMLVRANIYGKPPSFAVEKVLDSLDEIRGVWNFLINRRRGIEISFGGKRKPINKVLLGPLHTCHKSDGSLAVENFWYEPGYIQPIKTYRLQEDGILDSHVVSTQQKIKGSAFNEFLSGSFIRYARSLDEYDANNAFLKLWSLLESLTFSQNKNSELTVRRAAFLFEDFNYQLQILNHLRHLRNSFVHDSKDNEESITSAHQLRHYVEKCMEFLISNPFSFASKDEVARFWDMPTSKDELDAQEALIKQVMKYRKFD